MLQRIYLQFILLETHRIFPIRLRIYYSTKKRSSSANSQQTLRIPTTFPRYYLQLRAFFIELPRSSSSSSRETQPAAPPAAIQKLNSVPCFAAEETKHHTSQSGLHRTGDVKVYDINFHFNRKWLREVLLTGHWPFPSPWEDLTERG